MLEIKDFTRTIQLFKNDNEYRIIVNKTLGPFHQNSEFMSSHIHVKYQEFNKLKTLLATLLFLVVIAIEGILIFTESEDTTEFILILIFYLLIMIIPFVIYIAFVMYYYRALVVIHCGEKITISRSKVHYSIDELYHCEPIHDEI